MQIVQPRGKKLEFEIKKPFDLLVSLKNVENRSEWLAIANEVRTRIASSDKIIFIPELGL